MSYPGYGPPPTSVYAPPNPAAYANPVRVATSGYPTVPSFGLAAPPDADPQLWNWFLGVNGDRSGEITIVELQRALDHGDWAPFDLGTITLLMQLFDTERRGTIGFKQFSGIWWYIKDWQNLFRHFDRDRSGTIDASELRDALTQFGYRLTPRLIELIERKYASPVTYSGGPLPGITFDRFVRACVVVKQITESFKRHDANGDGWIQIDYDGFMEIVLSLP
ncbi:EF-hand [Boletus reticuloceps]|uniref:EF-hand n=1 Tax=Boletus reticuloceps TaxID=495285 RepID=A0A8I3AGX3_9AGAM|nr:EF-hand [Boletus reticuloceps]